MVTTDIRLEKRKVMEVAKNNWDNFWNKYKFNNNQDQAIIHQEALSVRWKKIEKIVLNRFGSFKDLKVIEIGSGRGEVLSLMALRGAQITLLDYSQIALGKAKTFLDNIGVKANLIKADIFDIPRDLPCTFDISMSFGLAEHFRYPQREEVIKIHANLLRPGGVSFIGVPNKFCLPYRFFMKLCDILGYKSEDIEIPFSRSELRAIAKCAEFKNYEITGSSFIRDSFYFLFSRYISHLTGWRVIVDISILEIPTILDDYLGYSLVLAGFKQ